MSRGVVLPDPILDFDPVEELDYGEDEPDIPGVVDPTQPSSSSQNRINSVDNLPAMINGDRDNNIGPALPPDFLTGSVDDGTPEDPGENSQNYNIGPALPPSFLLGPSLPDDETSGPPPEPSSIRSIGPALPPHLLLVVNQNDEEEDDEVDLYGPAPPPVNGNGSVDAPVEDYEDDDDDDVIGPALPPSGDRDEEQAAEEYALRRLAYEQEKEAQKNTTQREEWMLSLPQKLTNYGLGARTFSKGSGVEKDSSWTDAPGQKKRKIEDEPSTSSSLAAQKARDQEQERMARELNNSRQESLLDAHQKTKGPSGSNGTAPGVRRAFDREKDMEVRGFKNATSDEIKEKVGNLGSRFGSSKQQKYL